MQTSGTHRIKGVGNGKAPRESAYATEPLVKRRVRPSSARGRVQSWTMRCGAVRTGDRARAITLDSVPDGENKEPCTEQRQGRGKCPHNPLAVNPVRQAGADLGAHYHADGNGDRAAEPVLE